MIQYGVDSIGLDVVGWRLDRLVHHHAILHPLLEQELV
jgi:hypothetical protein